MAQPISVGRHLSTFTDPSIPLVTWKGILHPRRVLSYFVTKARGRMRIEATQRAARREPRESTESAERSRVRWPRRRSERFRVVSQGASSDDGEHGLSSSIDVTPTSLSLRNMSGDRSRALSSGRRRRRCVSAECAIVWGRRRRECGTREGGASGLRRSATPREKVSLYWATESRPMTRPREFAKGGRGVGINNRATTHVASVGFPPRRRPPFLESRVLERATPRRFPSCPQCRVICHFETYCLSVSAAISAGTRHYRCRADADALSILSSGSLATSLCAHAA